MMEEGGFKRPMMPPSGNPAKRSRFEDAGGQLVLLPSGQMVPSGPRIGAPSMERTSKLQAPIMLMTGHDGEIMTGRFSSEGDIFATAGYDQKIPGSTDSRNAVFSALFTCSTDKTVRIWDMETLVCKRKFANHLEIVNSCHPARRGPQLVVSGSDDGFVLVHDVRQRDPVMKFENRFSQTAVSFSDTAEYVFAGNIENDIVCYDMRRGEVEYTLEHHLDTITSISLSPDGTHLLSNSMDQTCMMFDVRPFVEGDRLVGAFHGHEHNFERNLLKCAWSPDGQWVTAGSADRFVYVWDVETGRIAYKLPGHQGSVVATDFHPKEPILLSAGTDKRIYLGELSPYIRS